MKKILPLFILLFMLSISVFAQNNMIKQSAIDGLENAKIQYQNLEIQQNIEKVMNNIQLQDRNRLQNATFESIGEQIRATVKEQQKLFNFININRNVEYEVLDDGTIIKQKRFFDFLFSEK